MDVVGIDDDGGSWCVMSDLRAVRFDRRSQSAVDGTRSVGYLEGPVPEGGGETGHGFGGGRRRLEVGLLDLQVDLFAVDLDLRRSLDPDPDVVTGDDEDGHFDVVADHDALTDTPAEN
jgi:hypothetical protein